MSGTPGKDTTALYNSPRPANDGSPVQGPSQPAPTGGSRLATPSAIGSGAVSRVASPGVHLESGFTVAGPEMPVTFGRGPVAYDKRKLKYDPYAARAASGGGLGFETAKEDRMDAVSAGNKLDEIHTKLGIHRAEPQQIQAFDDALWFCHTINGASALQTGDVFFKVGNTKFDFKHILAFIGPNPRRFFRAFSDMVRETNQRVISAYDPHDPVSVEHYGWLMEVAAKRGLLKYPDLAHDTADACLGLSPGEFLALAHSKQMVLNSTDNNVANYSANDRVRASSEVVLGQQA